ncbi:UNVERIFIED_CONTAM: hypothetical protein FKN15_064865 [Acipenser sinensis]
MEINTASCNPPCFHRGHCVWDCDSEQGGFMCVQETGAVSRTGQDRTDRETEFCSPAQFTIIMCSLSPSCGQSLLLQWRFSYTILRSLSPSSGQSPLLQWRRGSLLSCPELLSLSPPVFKLYTAAAATSQKQL